MLNLNDLSLTKTIDIMLSKGYKVFANDTKNYNLNIVGVRSNDNTVDRFSDFLLVFWKFRGVWQSHKFMCTTKPGSTYLGSNMMNKRGTAVIVPGQYRGLWKYGYHKGYRALEQIGNVTVARDADKDGQLDFDGKLYTGSDFGTNCHRANKVGKTKKVGPWSAGCIVLEDAANFDVMITLVKHAAAIHPNSFTFTLLNENDYSTSTKSIGIRSIGSTKEQIALAQFALPSVW